MSSFTPEEIMVTRAARELMDGEVVFVGIGLPNLACNLARRLQAPGLTLIYESGAVGAAPSRLPLSIGDPCLVTDSISVCPMGELFYYYLQGGLIDVGFLGGAQVDKYGNINSTVIGDYDRPEVRLPGSGGACDIALHAKKFIVILKQSKRNFPEKIDFVTSPGYAHQAIDEWRSSVPGGGPALVITDYGVYAFSPDTHEMILFEIHPHANLDDLKNTLSWDVRISDALKMTDEPSNEELGMLRDQLDPENLYLGR